MKITRVPAWRLLLIWLIFSGGSVAYATTHNAAVPHLKPVGSGQLTWFGLTVYEATLLAPDGRFQADEEHALKIDYRFRFSREQLAKASLEQIERLYGERQDGSQLVHQLEAVFSDVTDGDHIVGVHKPGAGASFYNQQGYLGTIEDPGLARDFFSIWLDPGTSEPALRMQLLGLTP